MNLKTVLIAVSHIQMSKVVYGHKGNVFTQM